METENKIRNIIHELREKYRINRVRCNSFKTDAIVKFNNAELCILCVGSKFIFSIGYSNPFKEITLSEYESKNELIADNCQQLFAHIYSDLMEFIDLWN